MLAIAADVIVIVTVVISFVWFLNWLIQSDPSLNILQELTSRLPLLPHSLPIAACRLSGGKDQRT